MPICIECRYPVPQLYHVLHSSSHKPSYTVPKPGPNGSVKSPSTPSSFPTPNPTIPKSKAGGESKSSGAGGGGDVRLTQCPRCKRFADKYVEHDFVVLFIDLVLVKPQVYRHLLFNRLGRDDDQFDPSITRLGTLLLLFDVYLTWSAIESLPASLTSASPIPHLPILAQYAFYLLLCTLTTLAHHLSIRLLASFFRSPPPAHTIPSPHSPPTNPTTNPPPTPSTNPHPTHNGTPNPHPTPSAISTALFVSSCMKLFPILLVVWKYDDVGGQVGRGVQWAVAVQNLEALRILLGCSYLRAGMLVAGGAVARWVVQRVVLGAVGLGDVGRELVGGGG